MTADERKVLKVAIDRATRERVARESARGRANRRKTDPVPSTRNVNAALAERRTQRVFVRAPRRRR
jgi:hypothetical protein